MNYSYEDIKQDHYFKVRALLETGVVESWELKELLEVVSYAAYNEGLSEGREENYG